MIAIGCALLTTIFAVVDGVLFFEPLSYPDDSRLMAVNVSSSRSRSSRSPVPGDSAAWKQAASGVTFTGFRVHTVDSTSSVARAVVQSDLLRCIGVRPALGGSVAEDFEPRVSTN